MASFRFPSLRRTAAKAGSRRRSRQPQSAGISAKRRFRRLAIDPLEERTLLTVAPVNTTDMLVNNPSHYNSLTALSSLNSSSIANVEETTNQQSIATDDAGDYVIAWVGSNVVLNPATESPWVNPATGSAITDENIYARYFTDEVQNLDLTQAYPGGASELLGTKTPTISLYFGQEVQSCRLRRRRPTSPAGSISPTTAR